MPIEPDPAIFLQRLWTLLKSLLWQFASCFNQNLTAQKFKEKVLTAKIAMKMIAGMMVWIFRMFIMREICLSELPNPSVDLAKFSKLNFPKI